VNVRARARPLRLLLPSAPPVLSIAACCAPPRGPPDSRTRRAAAAEIIAFDNVIVVYKFIGDLHFYATADAEENEVILATVLSALTETVSMLLAYVQHPARAALPLRATPLAVPQRPLGLGS